jgi:precorrin-6Y C5,15-methyltransferase (decarboxylating)
MRFVAEGEKAWLSIIGIGEDRAEALPPASHKALEQANHVLGAPRHLALAGLEGDVRARAWPVPFSIDPVLALRGQKVAMLVSGDPFWFGGGASVTRHLGAEEWRAYPAPSTFSWAAARLGWPLEDTACLGLHAAPFERLVPVMGQGRQAICLLRDGAAVATLSTWLVERGFGTSQCHVLEALGGAEERIRSAKAQDCAFNDVRAPVAMAIAFAGPPALPRASGLADDLFLHDGQITKRPVRALALSALAPRAGELLWDLGAGSGSISVEWCLAGGRSVAVERKAERAANIRANAEAFGLTHRLSTIEASHATLPDGPLPDAVFIGGGMDTALIERLWAKLTPGTRLVAHSVTLESEALLLGNQARLGGDLLRIELAQVAPLGSMRGWQPARPVVQWSVVR